ALAIALLYMSNLIMSSLYVYESISRVLEPLEYHDAYVFLWPGNRSVSWMINESVSLINKQDYIEVSGPIVYVEKYKLAENLTLILKSNGKPLLLPNGTVFIIMGWMGRGAGELNTTLYLSTDILSYNLGKGVVSKSDLDKVYAGIEHTEVFGEEVVIANNRLYPGKPYAPYTIIEGRPWTGGVFGEVVPRLYSDIYDTIRIYEAPHTRGKELYVILYTGVDKLDYFEEKIRDYGVASNNFYLRTSSAIYQLPLSLNIVSQLSDTFDRLKSYSNALVIVPVKYDLGKTIVGYSIAGSLKNIGEAIYALAQDTWSSSGCVTVYNDVIVKALQEMVFTEVMTRFITLIGIAPSLILVWIVSSRLPPVIVAILRKVIALIRIRGIGVSRIKKAFTIALVIWTVVGVLVGFSLSPLFIALVRGTSLDLLLRSFYNMLDPYTIIGLIAVTVITIIISVNKSFKILSRIAPREFTRPTVLVEQPLYSHGMDKGSWAALGLGVYYIVKTAIGFSPTAYMIASPPSPMILLIILLVLVLIEPIVLFLGPILFVYGMAKLLVAYPDRLRRIVETILSPIAGEFKHLVVRLLEVKPARIAVAVMVIGFSVGVLLSGVIGEYSMSYTLDSMEKTIYGTSYYIYHSYNLTYFTSHIDEIESEAARLIQGQYSIIVVVNIYNIVEGAQLYIGNTEIQHIVFIDKDSYTKLFYLPPGISSGLNTLELVEGLGDWKVLLAAAPSMDVPDLGVHDLVVKSGLKSTNLAKLDIYGRLYTLPGAGALANIAGLATGRSTTSIGPNAEISLPILEPTLVMDKSMLKEFMSSLRDKMESLGVSGRTMDMGVDIVCVVAVDKAPPTPILGDWMLCNTTVYKSGFENTRNFLLTSMQEHVSTGLALYITGLATTAILAYASIYENLYAFTLLRARGVRARKILVIALGEGLAISTLGIIPGIILGAVLGLNTPRALFMLSISTYELARLTGIEYIPWLPPSSLIALTLIPVVIILVSLIISYTTFRKVLREAITVLGSHI
ncbi:MAG: ABC transporter permease, partial [Desulfurococcales archaeon]|nr:ABC transporter permease [Desulfurococcales archaeon]